MCACNYAVVPVENCFKKSMKSPLYALDLKKVCHQSLGL